MANTDFKSILFLPFVVWTGGQFAAGDSTTETPTDKTDTQNDSSDDTKLKAIIVCGVLIVVAIILLIALIIVCKKYLNYGKNYRSRSTEKEALCRRDDTPLDTIREASQETHITRLECENGQAVSERDREVIATVHMQPGDHCLLNRRPQVNGGPPLIGGSHYSQPKDCNGYDPYASYTSINSLEAEKNEINRPTNLYENVSNQSKKQPSDVEILDNNAINKIRLNSDVEHFTVGTDDYAIVKKTRKSRSSEGSDGAQSPRVPSAYDNLASEEMDIYCHQSRENILPIPARGYRQSDFYIKDWANKKDTAV